MPWKSSPIRLRETGRTLLLCGARDQPAELLARARAISGAASPMPRDIAADLAPEIAHDMEVMKI